MVRGCIYYEVISDKFNTVRITFRDRQQDFIIINSILQAPVLPHCIGVVSFPHGNVTS